MMKVNVDPSVVVKIDKKVYSSIILYSVVRACIFCSFKAHRNKA